MFLICRSPQYFLPFLESVGLSVLEIEVQNRFSRWPPMDDGHLLFLIGASNICSTGCPNISNHVSSQLTQGCRGDVI